MEAGGRCLPLLHSHSQWLAVAGPVHDGVPRCRALPSKPNFLSQQAQGSPSHRSDCWLRNFALGDRTARGHIPPLFRTAHSPRPTARGTCAQRKELSLGAGGTLWLSDRPCFSLTGDHRDWKSKNGPDERCAGRSMMALANPVILPLPCLTDRHGYTHHVPRPRPNTRAGQPPPGYHAVRVAGACVKCRCTNSRPALLQVNTYFRVT